jgi:hypothetical protein
VTRPIAVGWATVELERAVAELADRLVPGTAFRPAPDSVLLGARCLVGDLADPVDGATRMVLLEPATEGRLAATLARHDEGWCASWVEATDADPAAAPTRAQPGPFGPERLLAGGAMSGPHRLVVTPATIGP